MTRFATLAFALLASSLACSQTNDNQTQQNDNGGLRFQLFDACGLLKEGNGCILFEGGGGTYVLPDAGGFDFGDVVRVVGTLDPECVTICTDADGCIRGAAVYDPTVFPCGTDLPNFPDDIFTNACSSLGTALPAAALVGLWLTRRRRT
jgi:hypothetical protein